MTGPRIEESTDTYFIGCYTKRKKLRAIKIGVCGRGMSVPRLRTLQTGSVDRLVLLGVFQGNIERKAFRLLKAYRLRAKSEFFKAAPKVLKLIKDLNKISRLLALLDTRCSGTQSAESLETTIGR